MTKLTRRDFAQGLGAVLLTASPALADGWELLGERKVTLKSDRDVIPVTLLRGDFRKLRIKVAGKAVFFNDVVVVYGNGAVDQIPIRALIRAGGQSRVIDLRGGNRIIKKVELLYRSVPTSLDWASVRVYAR
ncbi:MAG: hypothetical protein ACRC14_11290 [Paracoccaceae bacterium]